MSTKITLSSGLEINVIEDFAHVEKIVNDPEEPVRFTTSDQKKIRIRRNAIDTILEL